jgi:hypothetical protein
LDKAEIGLMGAVKPEMVLGYSEENRLRRIAQCDEFLRNQYEDVKTRLAKVKEVEKKAHRKQDKEQAA